MPDEKPHTPDSPESPKDDKVSEVRYVPVGYLPHIDEDDEIDLMELVKKIWNGRWTIVKITGVFIVIGLFVALFSPEEFESDAILMPEAQAAPEGRAGQLMQQFGGAFGLGGISQRDMPQGMIPPMIYPRIVNSLSFQLELMEQEIHFREYGVTTTWPDFLENHYSKPLTAWVTDYTIKLPLTILSGVRSLFEPEEEMIVQEDPLEAEFITITREQHQLVEQLRERISVSQDQETGLLTTRVKLQDARAAAELNRFLIERLKEYVTEYRVEKARQNLEFAEQQKQEAQERFEQAQVNLAEFRDQNINVATARAQIELERLQDEKDLAFNVYNSLSQRVEETRLNLQEQTPIFKEVQPVNVPSQRSEPKRALMMIIFTLLGGILATGWIFVGPLIEQFKSFGMEG